MDLLEPIKDLKHAETVLNGFFSRKEVVMGFGHRVYKKEDPRSEIIKQYAIKLSEQKYGNKNLLEIQKYIEHRMKTEKNIYANLDFYSASAYN
jgi:2-methylcitrate synthase